MYCMYIYIYIHAHTYIHLAGREIVVLRARPARVPWDKHVPAFSYSNLSKLYPM